MPKVPLVGKHGEGRFAIVDKQDIRTCLKRRWRLGENGYVYWSRNGHSSVTIAHFILGIEPQMGGLEPDHINRNTLDNRRSNLRLVTRGQNLMNRITRRGKTGLKYVYFTRYKNGRERFIGRPPGYSQREFRTLEEAAEYIRGVITIPKVKYDVSNVEDSGGFEHVQPGMYIGKISEVNLKESKSGNGPMLEIILQPVKTADGKTVKAKDKKKQVARVYTYVLLEHEPSDWKLKEFIKAVGLKDKGMIDTDKLVGNSVQMNLKPDTDLNDQYRPRVGKLLAIPAGAKTTATDNGASEPEDEAEEDYTEDDLNEMEDDELKEAAGEYGVKAPTGTLTSLKRKKLIAAILESMEESEDEDEDEDEEEDADVEDDASEDEEDEDEDESDEDEADELDGLSRAELKQYIKDNELEVRVTKSMEDDDIRDAIVEAQGTEDEEEDEDEEPVDYNSWSIDALKKEAQERGLSTKGSKKILAGRLGKDDEDEDNPF